MIRFVILLLLTTILLNCSCRPENIIINIKYVGDFDFPMDVYLANYIHTRNSEKYQQSYLVEDGCSMSKIADYVIENQSKKTFRSNKLKIAIFKGSTEETYYFDAKDGTQFIEFLIKNIDVKSDLPDNPFGNKYFKNSELPPYINQLKSYSGREWMNEVK